jgi:hypothetical protein
MSPKRILSSLWKLAVCSLAFIGGMLLGGMLITVLGMQAPTLPPEMDASSTMLIMYATSPLLVLALIFVNRGLAGGWLARTAMLFLLAWIAYTVNNVIEARIFSSYETASWFTVATFTPALLLCAAATAWLFPPHSNDKSLSNVWKEHFQQRTAVDWAWRMLLSAVIFMPIYYFFGLFVVPFVGDYYSQGAFGLSLPPLSTLLMVLFVRSVLFLIACLPVVIVWQETRLRLTLSLGFALFMLVGLLNLLLATWIAPQVRIVHSIEIMADSLVYAGALTLLLGAAEPVTRSISPVSHTEGAM